MTRPEDIKNWILTELPDSVVEVDGDGQHFAATIVRADFEGLPTMARHRMIYAALGDHMKSDIHALSLRTLTPDETE